MNRLAAETSPYLRQHRDNPVHWFAWGPEAFEKALTKNGIKHSYRTYKGGHVWPVWRWSLAEFAPELFRNK